MEVQQNMTGTDQMYSHGLWAHPLTKRFWVHVSETQYNKEEGTPLRENSACIVLDLADCIKLRDELSAFINNRNIANETS